MYHHLILRVNVKMLVGVIVLFGLYVQFHGDYSPGGGFQAGVIVAAGIILYSIVMGLERAKKVFPSWFAHKLMALGLLIYIFVGIYSLLKGYNFLDYDAILPDDKKHAQHYGILLVEIGVGITVAGVIVSVFYAFASRTPHLDDSEW